MHRQRVAHSKINVQEVGGSKHQADLSPYIKATNWQFDNSWHERHKLGFLDLCVFVGTPEWLGSMVGPLVSQLSVSKVPVVYLGVGGFERREGLRLDQLSPDDQAVLRRAALIAAPDDQAAGLLQDIGVLRLPCPALFSTETQRVRTGDRLRIALSTQPNDSRQPLSNGGVSEYTQTLFVELAKQFDCDLICHYVDELEPLKSFGVSLRYSYDARDYLQIYDAYDLVVTTRVHGAGIAASLRVPSLVIKHSARTSTADGFLADYIDPNMDTPAAVIDRIRGLDISKRSGNLITHKAETREKYLELLSSRLGLGRESSRR